MLHLVCVPAGAGISDSFIKKALQQEYEKTLVVVSSEALVQNARLRGVNAVNFDYLANDVLRQCGCFQVRRISRKAQELIVEEILQGLQEQGSLPYFEKLIAKRGFLSAVASLLDQLGGCGVTAEEIRNALFHWDGRSAASRQKDEEIADIYQAYISHLVSHDLYDMAGLYRLAAEELGKLLQSGQALKWDTVYFMGFYRFEGLQISMLRSLSRFCDVWVALPYEGDRPGLYGAAESAYGDLMRDAMREVDPAPVWIQRTASLRHIMETLRKPGAKPVTADSGIEIWRADDRTGEMRAVLRDIKKQLRSHALNAEETAIVVRRMEDYSGIRALCDEYGIPVRLRGTASLAANPVFCFIVSLLASVSLYGREKAEKWIGFLTQPFQRIALTLPTETVIQLAGNCYYTDYRKFLEDVLRQTDCESLRELLNAVEDIPLAATVQEYCERIQGILSALSLQDKAGQLYREGELTLLGFKNIACAQEALQSLLQELPQDYRICGYENRKIACSLFTEALREAAGKVSLTLQPENSAGIAVLSAVNLEEVSYKQVYVLGLRENEFPYLKKENWIYSDSERGNLAALGIALPASADGYREDIHFFANACAAATERLVLTFFTDDEQNASPYIAEIQSLFTDLPVQNKKTQIAPGDSLSREELELALACGGQKKALQKLEPGLAEIAGSDWKRIAKEAGWNGKLTDPDLIRQAEQQIGDSFSASKLETYRSCPFKFLVSYVWQQQSPDTAEEDMNPARRGTLLHKVLETFVRGHLGEPLTASQEKELQAELDRIFTETWREFADRGLLYAGDFWQYDRELQRLILHRWLRNEIRYSETGELRPLYTEKEFGRKDAGLMSMDIGGRRILLNGKIDRIDKAGNAYYITDYKSGKAPQKTDFLNTDLQMPLYLLAAERLVAAPEGGRIIGGGYYMLKDGERGDSFLLADAAEVCPPWKNYSEITDEDGNKTLITDTNLLRQKTEQVVADILQGMGQGCFEPTPDRDCDRNCPAAKICRFRLLTRDRDEEEPHG